MKYVSLADARAEATDRLTNYRTERQLIHKAGKGARLRSTRLARWAHAIETVRAMYESTQPEKARAMDRLFGLTHVVPKCQNNRNRIIRLAQDFCISESTMYKWRDEIVMATLLAGVEAGAFKPYGIGK